MCYYDDGGHSHKNLQHNVDYFILQDFNGKRKAIKLCDACADELGYDCEFCEKSFEPYCDIIQFNCSVYHAECFDRIKYFIDNNQTALTCALSSMNCQ